MMFLFQHPGTALASWTELEAEARGALTEAHNAFTSAQESLQKITEPEHMSDEDNKNMGAAMLHMITAQRGYGEAEALLKQTKSSLVNELKSIRKFVKKQGDETASAQLAELEAYVKHLEEQIKACRLQGKQIDSALAPLKKMRVPA